MNMQAQTVSWWRVGLGNLIARLFGEGRRPDGGGEAETAFVDGFAVEKIAPNGFWSNFSRKSEPHPEVSESPRLEPNSATNILVPLDFSPASFRAMDWAMRLARQTRCRVTLLHVVHLNLTPYGPGNPIWLAAALRREAAAKAEAIVANARAAGVAVECQVEEGVPAQVIAAVATRQAAQMIVMATPKRGPLARLFRQQTVEDVIRNAHCPVLVLQTGLREGIL